MRQGQQPDRIANSFCPKRMLYQQQPISLNSRCYMSDGPSIIDMPITGNLSMPRSYEDTFFATFLLRVLEVFLATPLRTPFNKP